MNAKGTKSYKDDYHFRDIPSTSRLEDFPSLFEDNPKINSSIKKNTERANVEIEKDEIVLQPDMSALFKANGKKHSGGGIDVMLRPNSFIFSDDKSLKITKDENDLFEFKKGGKFKDTTPANVVKKNVDMEHYNRLVSILSDPKKDDLSKRSSALMLDKYTKTLGQVAYLQEMKKNFPDGIPPFAEGTAPVSDPQLKSDIMENKQYVKYGGKILPKAQLGDWWKPLNNYEKNIPAGSRMDEGSEQVIGGKIYKVVNNKLIDTTQSRFNLPTVVLNSSRGKQIKKIELSGVEPLKDNISKIPIKDIKIRESIIPRTPFDTPLPPLSNPTPTNIDAGDGTISADWEFTPYQKESQAYNLFKALNVKRYMPYRSHMNASYLDPALVNPEQAIGDMQNAYNQNIRAAENLNPILRNAQNQDSYGQLLDKMPGVRSQYDNQNAGILNNARQNNNQIKNNETQTNLGFDQKYYQEEVTGRANSDNMKNYLGDQYMNNRMRDVETNQSLAYNLLTQEDPAYNLDWKNGKFTRTKKSILDAKTNKLDDSYKELFDVINRVHDPAVRARLMVDAYKQKHILPYLKGISE